MRNFILLISICVLTVKLSAQVAIFVGPMIHWNFKTNDLTWGVELSYWDFNNNNSRFQTNNQLSYDIGFEKSKGKFSIYAEYQRGYNDLVGFSTGIIEEFSLNAKPKTGIQGSIWGAFILGADLRCRIFLDELNLHPGLFIKVPIKFEDEIFELPTLRFM